MTDAIALLLLHFPSDTIRAPVHRWPSFRDMLALEQAIRLGIEHIRKRGDGLMACETSGQRAVFAFSVLLAATLLGSCAIVADPPATSGSESRGRFGLVKISAIQGREAVSPMVGREVIVRGVLTGYAPNLGGFYIQSMAGDEDHDALTSEGIFVHLGEHSIRSLTADSVGDLVTIGGQVAEFKGQTEISYSAAVHAYAVDTARGKLPLPVPVPVKLPVSSLKDWEAVEGMLVVVSSATEGGKLVVTDNHDWVRYGQAVLTSDAVQVQFTEIHAPDKEKAGEYGDQLKLDQIIVDDLHGGQHPMGLVGRRGEPLSAGNPLRAGDSIAKLVGIVDQFQWQFDNDANSHPKASAQRTSYRLQPVAGAPVFAAVPRPTAQSIPAAIRNAEIKVASVNVLNLFSTLGKKPFAVQGGGKEESRGASHPVELSIQLEKIVSNLRGLDADVVGLMEIQNNGFDAPSDATAHNGKSAIRMLVDALNVHEGAGAYAYVEPEQTGSDAIMVAIIYKTDKLIPVPRGAVIPDASKYPALTDKKYGNRLPIGQAFESRASGSQFTLVVNHFKSKGKSRSQDDLAAQGEDTGDGQGHGFKARAAAAEQLADWIRSNPAGASGTHVLLVGDFNAYSREDPVRVLEGKGFRKISSGYSYGFDGLWGSLDHAFASSSLESHVAGVYKWPINAEEPADLDYNMEYKTPRQQRLFYSGDAYRSSDHNPIVIGLNLRSRTAAASAVQAKQGGQ